MFKMASERSHQDTPENRAISFCTRFIQSLCSRDMSIIEHSIRLISLGVIDLFEKMILYVENIYQGENAKVIGIILSMSSLYD